MGKAHDKAAGHLSAGGAELYADIDESREMDSPTRALVLQACRLVDRLDRLDAAIRSRATWFELAEDAEDDTRFVVVVDSVLAEFRQQAMALSQIMTKLGAGQLGRKKNAGNGVSERASDDLAARREARIAGAATAQLPGIRGHDGAGGN